MKVTMYTKSEFLGNIIKKEITLVNFEENVSYAQYRNSTRIDYRPKQSRKTYRKYLHYRPYMVIVEGWKKPDAPEAWSTVQMGGGLIAKTPRHKTFSSAAEEEFDQVVDSGLLGNIILDKRHTKGYTAN